MKTTQGDQKLMKVGVWELISNVEYGIHLDEK